MSFIGNAVKSIGNTVGGLLGGSSGSAPSQPNTQVYQPGGTSSVDATLANLLKTNANYLSGSNPYNTLSPQIQQAFQQLFNTPGTSGYTNAANVAGGAYTGVGAQGLGLSSELGTAVPTSLLGGANVLNMGMDPQNALYQQLLQRTTDQANVANAQYGLQGQQAAGNVNQATTNFNIDWQNQELERALQGLSGFNQSAATAGTVGTAGQNIGTAGAGDILTGGTLPYAAGQTIGGNQETALAQYIQQLLGPVSSSQNTISQLQSYLNEGVGASSSGANAALADYYAQLQNSANLGSGLGGLLGLGNGSGGTLGSSLYNTASNLIPSGSSLASYATDALAFLGL